MVANLGMDSVSKVDDRSALREIDDVTFWRINKDSITKKVDLHQLVKVSKGVSLTLPFGQLRDPAEFSFSNLADLATEIVEGSFLIGIVPMSCNPKLRLLVHGFGPNLNL